MASQQAPAPTSDPQKVSRLFPVPLSQDTHLSVQSANGKDTQSGSTPAHFHPPSGSRLLALGTRPPAPAKTSLTSPQTASFQQQTSGQSSALVEEPLSLSNVNAFSSNGQSDVPTSASEAQPPTHMLLPSDPSASRLDRPRDSTTNTIPSSGLGSERPIFDTSAAYSDSSPRSDPPSNIQSPSSDPNEAVYGQGRGSRFAKFFDGKAKDGAQQSSLKSGGPSGMISSSALRQRQEFGGFNNSGDSSGDMRAINDIFAMLHNSAQVDYL